MKLFVTTPIFYVNAKPHVGHLYSMVLADVRNRWCRLNKGESLFITGTDEHGMKVQKAAENNGQRPQEFVDTIAPTFVNLARVANVRYDRFVRTTDADHVRTVQSFWKKLADAGHIYKGQHSGWYSVSDETFYPESQIQETEPGVFVSKETNTKVVYFEENNYFFRLSKFYKPLLEHLKQNKDFIVPRSRQDELIQQLESAGKLEDLSVSRPSSRLQWAIEVPQDPSQTVYVWLDALVNYYTCSQAKPGLWPPTHVIGKDIVKFHAVYWPIFLMAAGIELPKQLVVHGHWLCGGSKMSKSVGNVVDPLQMINKYGEDVVRVYLCENSVLESDSNFSELELFYTHDNLVSKFSNLIVRCCGKKFNIERAVQGKAADYSDFANVAEFEQLKACLESVVSKFGANVESFKHAHAMGDLWEVINLSNRVFQNSEPWTLEGPKQDAVVYVCAEAARICSILLSPVAPTLSAKFLDRLGVHADHRGIEYCALGSDEYGAGANKKGDFPLAKMEKP